MSDKFGLIWWVLFLPVIGFAIQALVGGRVVKSMGPAAGRRIMGWIAVLPIAIAFGIGVVVTQQLAALPDTARSATTTLFPWIQFAGLNIPFEFRVDPLSMTMVLIVTGVGGLIHLYATGYMHEEKDYTRFFTYLNLFIAAMLILVLGNNLVMMFIGWEGVGLCSYLLIGFWYKDLANARAANKAFIVNRIGDWGFSLGIFLLAVLVGSQPGAVQQSGGKVLSYDTLFQTLPSILQAHPALATTAALLLFVGACGKSAQFPLYLWLPDAMAGPTPVSALIHAATMVTSGVVLLNRMHIVFEMSPVASAVVACVGAFTALFAALVAFGQTDIKKVLAYSTVSQLGFMFVACGAGAYWVGMFHVTTHAFFKALLFLGSGSVIMAMAHNQDMRNYGKLAKYLPVTCWTMFAGFVAIAGLSIPGVFGFSGYYSKEPIIGSALGNDFASINGINLGYYAGWTALFAALLTAFYMTRMTMLTFFGKKEQWREIPAHAHADHEDAALEAEHGQGGHTTLEKAGDHGHGPDIHGFFYTHDEMHALEHADHEHEHHALDANHTPKERSWSMLGPLVVLAILSAGAGWYLANGQMFEKWLEPSSAPTTIHISPEVEHLPGGLSLVAYSAIAAFGGLALGLLIYWNGLPKKEGWDERKWSWFRLWARNQFSYDPAMMTAAVQGGNDVGQLFWRFFDAGIVDGIVNGLAKLAGWFGSLFHRVQTGYVRLYALVMLAGGVGLIGWFAYAAHLAGGGH
ncbi:MAG TPA: NADH-quinone oxidoreductase subunit L [Fimbriimonadaceae bacterium]|nr:NADH-quinone oxidoreductase subunit L [Fimbriimonadaceae bacterium]